MEIFPTVSDFLEPNKISKSFSLYETEGCLFSIMNIIAKHMKGTVHPKTMSGPMGEQEETQLYVSI